MLQNQVQRQADGGQLQQRNPNPRTASASSSSSSSSSFPTSSYCLPPTVSTNSSRAPSSEISPISSYNPYPAYPPAYPRNSSFDFDGYPSTASSSSSSNPYPLPSVSFDEAFLHSPNAYPFQHQSDPSSGRGFADVLQLHNSPPVLFQQPHAPVDEDEYLSSSTASFAHSPMHLDGGGGWQEAAYGSLDYDDGLVRQGSTRPELVRVVENRRSQDEPMSTSSQLPQGNNETLGVQQTAFISKVRTFSFLLFDCLFSHWQIGLLNVSPPIPTARTDLALACHHPYRVQSVHQVVEGRVVVRRCRSRKLRSSW